jgi:alanine racemase
MRNSTYLEVDLDLLGHNFKCIQDLAPKAQILPMVKADAYGHGIVPVSRYLVNTCGVKTLGCATLAEAVKILGECPELPVRIIVFSDNELSNPVLRKSYLSHNIIPVLATKEDLETVLGNHEFDKLPLILKCNTGMNRLGLSLSEIKEFLPEIKKRGVEHLLTHFARSSQVLKEGDKTHKQYQEFNEFKNFLISEGVAIKESSVSNSGAIEQGFGVEETHVRPGLMLYGPASVPQSSDWKGKQISRFVTKVIHTFEAKKGTPVGYGDGILTYYSGTKVTLKGHEGKIFGRINMDLTFIQFDVSAKADFKAGDEIELWGHDDHIITDIADQNKTISYQVMCGISSRIPRIYKVK